MNRSDELKNAQQTDLSRRVPDRNDLQNTVITDLPGREEKPTPRELPSPRHRPGEPILFESPTDAGRDVLLPMGNSVADPFTGRPMIDPM